ncbi:MAG TPA: flagellar assembly protein FliH [Myxococcales bacterium]|nr:flagellar assembly protein FliH [Myxococcales bacterium]
MPPYRLQTLLEIRQRAKEAAEQAFSEAVREVARQEKEQQRLERDLEERKAGRKAKVDLYLQEIMARGAGVSGMNSMNRYELRLKDEEAQVALEIERQKEVVKRAKKAMEEKRQEMAQAAMDLKAIEKHKEKWEKEVKAARQAREELVQEEIGNALHLARTRREQPD